MDVVDERMAFIRARTVEVRREANEALDLGMETSSGGRWRGAAGVL